MLQPRTYNRLKTESGAKSGTKSYSYDANGNMVSKGSEVYRYNQLNRQVSAGAASYTYRPDGLRESKTTANGKTTYHSWDMNDIVADTVGGTVKTYLRGVGLLRLKTGNTICYYQKNAHGDVVQYLNSKGNASDTYKYTAFGVERSGNEKQENPFRYCGEYYDFETSSVYLRARYYVPGIGRFTQSDPAQDGLNYYTYCYNNPVKFVDPLGLYIVLAGANNKGYKNDVRFEELQKLTNYTLTVDKNGKEGDIQYA